MNKPAKQIEALIMGQSYQLSCPAGQEKRIQTAVSKVDTTMRAIHDQGRVKLRERVAVLAALNLAFEMEGKLAADYTPAVHAALSPQALSDGWQSWAHKVDNFLGEDGALI